MLYLTTEAFKASSGHFMFDCSKTYILVSTPISRISSSADNESVPILRKNLREIYGTSRMIYFTATITVIHRVYKYQFEGMKLDNRIMQRSICFHIISKQLAFTWDGVRQSFVYSKKRTSLENMSVNFLNKCSSITYAYPEWADKEEALWQSQYWAWHIVSI